MSTVSPKGTIAKAATAVRIEITGARANSQPIDVRGRNCSLVANFTISAIGWSIPNGPTRFGP
jgi:hypothetical protein